MSVLIISSCESDDSSSKSNEDDSEKLLEMTCVVKMRSFNDWTGSQAGDVAQYDCGDKRIIYTTETKALRQKESCSGFYSVDHTEITIDDILIVKYKKKDIDYTLTPTTVRATSIEAYRPECVLGPVVDPNVCSQCGQSTGNSCSSCNNN